MVNARLITMSFPNQGNSLLSAAEYAVFPCCSIIAPVSLPNSRNVPQVIAPIRTYLHISEKIDILTKHSC